MLATVRLLSKTAPECTKSPNIPQVLYSTDTLLLYEAQPRYTLESEANIARSSLAVRFRKVITKTLGRPKLPRSIETTRLDGYDIAFLTGSHPVLIFQDELEGLVCTSWTEPINCLTTLNVSGISALLLCAEEVSGKNRVDMCES